MELFPNDILSSLDFNFVKNAISGYCSSPEAKNRVQGLLPISDSENILTNLRSTDEILAHLQAGDAFPSTIFEAVQAYAQTLKTKGTVLEEKAFAEIRSTLSSYEQVYSFLEKRKNRFAVLFSQIEEVVPEKHLVNLINAKIDERGQVLSNASKELANIRSKLSKSRASAARIFDRVLKKYQNKGYLADFNETVSENRRVLAIQSTYKGQVQGIFHGSSSKNSIVYVEPAETVEVNNEIAQLIDDERQEIRRILKELSNELRPYAIHLIDTQENMTLLDFAKAKALYAKNEDCSVPEIDQQNKEVFIKEGYNPVLKSLNREKQKETKPVEIHLHPEQRILVISGPNAGGKTIALKTLGLLSGMLQSGIPIPVDPASKFRFFERIFVDIGDTQSIQNELSTYSSKLQKMRHFLTHGDEDTLLLIDEFGSGSDPELGSALAQVFLEKLNSFKVYGIFTTHYNAIKALAANLTSVSNAAMLFNKSNLTPEYILQTGNPGSSYTFEVAGQSGIPPHIITEAREKTNKSTLDVDQLLVQLQDDKLQLEKKHSRLNKELSNLKKLERERESTIQKLEEKLSKQSRINEENDRIMYWGQRFQKLVEGWMDQKGKKDKKEVVGRFIGILNQRSSEVEQEEKKSYSKAQSQREKQLEQLKKTEVKVGDQVQILETKMRGTISEIKRGKYVVALGNNITTTVDREQFIKADVSLQEKPKRKKRKKSFGKKKPDQKKDPDNNTS